MAAAAIPFPNYTQIPSRLSLSAWRAIRVTSMLAALVVAGLLIARPSTGLFVMWKVVIPLLPVTFMVAPGVWRNVCPLATSNQTPRALGITRALKPPRWLQEYGYLIAVSGFVGFVILRKAGLDRSGPFSALLLLGAMTSAFAGGMVFKGKSGWCSTMCPLLPVQRVYGQTPFALVGNNHCQPCVGCVKNCYDFNPRVAFLADLHEQDGYWSGYRRLFVGAFPGLVYGFFNLGIPGLLLAMAVSTALFTLAIALIKVSAHTITTLFGATAFGIFYWFAAPVRPLSGVAIALAAVWVYRTLRKEKPFLEQAAAPVAPVASASVANHRARGPEVTIGDTTISVSAGATLLEVAEANDLPIEAGCRMGICGADPVAVKDGMGCLSAISADEQSTLDRLGLAENTRLACCARVNGPVTVSLTPDKPGAPRLSRIASFKYDRSIERVVIVGNGIAGVTAADHVRRRHPETAIDLIAKESHHLYNRMGIARLVYGRSAMEGLYLNPEAWYAERGITTWLNTRAQGIDRGAREVKLATGERLRYDRLILAMGSRSRVPRIEGFGAPGTGVLRTADDALGLRAFAQRHGAKTAVVAGGGLLGLEAAYALHKLGLRASVLERSDRLLRRQLDDRAAQILQAHLEGLGIEIVKQAEAAAVEANGRLGAVQLTSGHWLDTEILLVAAGITPNAELARKAGLRTNRGVLVDERMRTDDPHVFAAGDLAEFEGNLPGLWPTAVSQAEVAADNAAGGTKTYVEAPPVTILKVVGIDLTSIGRFEPLPGEEEIVLEDAAGYRKLVISDGRIAGAILLGSTKDVAPVRAAIDRGIDVSGHLAALRAGRWQTLAE